MGKSVQKWLKLRGLKAAVLTKFKRFKLIIDGKIWKQLKTDTTSNSLINEA